MKKTMNQTYCCYHLESKKLKTQLNQQCSIPTQRFLVHLMRMYSMTARNLLRPQQYQRFPRKQQYFLHRRQR